MWWDHIDGATSRWCELENNKSSEKGGGRKEKRGKKEKRKISITSPVLVRLGQNQSSFSSGFLKPIQFQFRFSETNPVSFGQLGIKSSFSWGKENQSNTNPFHGPKTSVVFRSKCNQSTSLQVVALRALTQILQLFLRTWLLKFGWTYDNKFSPNRWSWKFSDLIYSGKDRFRLLIS